jgi:hypothetical protein
MQLTKFMYNIVIYIFCSCYQTTLRTILIILNQLED